jgi:hypothetical protein
MAAAKTAGASRGQLPLHPQANAQRHVDVGFEHGCPGPQVHLGLRFRDKPGTGVDGTAFPRAEWEQSPFFTPSDYPVGLSGVAGVEASALAPAAPAAPAGAARPAAPAATLIDPTRWKELVSRSTAVSARYFLVHDTGGGGMPTAAPRDGSRGIHLFIGGGRAFLNHDFAGSHTGTKFEQHHHEFRGQIIHMEIANRSQDTSANPPDTYGDADYRFAALAYVYASYRAHEWLTVTCHLEVDRGFPNGHCDPRGFTFSKLYSRVGLLVPSVSGKTFGILQARIGDNRNMAGMKNTFPAQYGPVQYETRVRK